MKPFIYFTALLMFVIAASASLNAKVIKASEAFLTEGEEEVIIPIEGMSCMSCVARIKKTLSGLDGVKEVKVNLQDRNAIVKYDSKKITPEKLQKSINDMGYKAGKPQFTQK